MQNEDSRPDDYRGIPRLISFNVAVDVSQRITILIVNICSVILRGQSTLIPRRNQPITEFTERTA